MELRAMHFSKNILNPPPAPKEILDTPLHIYLFNNIVGYFWRWKVKAFKRSHSRSKYIKITQVKFMFFLIYLGTWLLYLLQM